MAKYRILKSPNLTGSVRISGAKNAALPIMAATLLAQGDYVIDEAPCLNDIENMCCLLGYLGCAVDISTPGIIKISSPKALGAEAPYELVNKLRASFLVMGPLLAKNGRVRISLPGGCAIGSRPVDLHLKGFASMGAKITQKHGFIEASTRKLQGAKIYLDFPSVGATENILMAASLADGQTIIENAASEPEIVDLANFINSMGGDVRGAGTDTIRINGVKGLRPASHSVIPDRIEAGTFMVAAAITKGHLKIENVVPEHLKPISAKLREMGVRITEGDNYVIVDGTEKLVATDIKTLPFPGFPTDMQAPFCSLMTLSDGTSVILETIFENRFLYAPELNRMGAKIKIDGRFEIIAGTKRLTGAQVRATDLRAGAALVLAGLAAEDETIINDIEHIDRGYTHFDKKLSSIGANIARLD